MSGRALPTHIAPILTSAQGAAVGGFRGRAIRSGVSRIDGLDIALICLLLAGLYTHYTIQLSATVPFPSAPAGVAGMILLWRRREQITSAAFAGFLAVVLLYLLSIF